MAKVAPYEKSVYVSSTNPTIIVDTIKEAKDLYDSNPNNANYKTFIKENRIVFQNVTGIPDQSDQK